MLREPSHHCGLLLWRIYELKSAVHRFHTHDHTRPLQQHSFNVPPSFFHRGSGPSPPTTLFVVPRPRALARAGHARVFHRGGARPTRLVPCSPRLARARTPAPPTLPPAPPLGSGSHPARDRTWRLRATYICLRFNHGLRLIAKGSSRPPFTTSFLTASVCAHRHDIVSYSRILESWR